MAKKETSRPAPRSASEIAAEYESVCKRLGDAQAGKHMAERIIPTLLARVEELNAEMDALRAVEAAAAKAKEGK